MTPNTKLWIPSSKKKYLEREDPEEEEGYHGSRTCGHGFKNIHRTVYSSSQQGLHN